MSVQSEIRDALVTLVESVSNVGAVHNRARFTADWSNFNTLFKATIGGVEQIRGWWVQWSGITATNVPGTGFGDDADIWRFTIRGVLALKDAGDTETTFNDLMLAIVNAIRASSHLGEAEVMRYSHRVTTSEPDIRQFGSVVCNYGEIYVDVTVITG